MAIPAINVLGNPNVTEGNFQIAIEDLRKSVIGSGKAYDAANTYSQYDTCVYSGVSYYSKINSNTGNTPAIGTNWGLESELIKLIASPTTNVIPKINADGTLGNSNIINDANGNVGIGISSVYDRVQVNGSIGLSNGGYFGFYRGSGINTITTDGVTIPHFGIGSGIVSGNTDASVWLSGYKDLRMMTIGTERMRIVSNGNLLVGTSTDNGVDKLQVNGSIGATKSNLRTGVQYGASSTLTVTVPANSSGTLCINAYYNGNQAHTWTLPFIYYTDSGKAVGTPLSAGNATLISSAVINNGGNIVVTLASSEVYLTYSLSITN